MKQTKKTQQQQKPQPYEQVGKRYRSLGKQFLEINNMLEQNNDYTSSTLVIKHYKRSTFRTYRRCYRHRTKIRIVYFSQLKTKPVVFGRDQRVGKNYANWLICIIKCQ